MTGAPDGERAVHELAKRTPCAIVTLGDRGAVAVCDGETLQVPGIPAEPVDTTGAGDLFTAAYVWADLLGLALEERLRWAVLYATLSVRVPTALAGAVSRSALLEEGAARGLVVPASQPSVPMKEEAR
jgi:sugar/nucleoside kinase (ribokinase family)